MDRYYRRLPLTGLRNARELGGYPLDNGGVTRYGRFLRCEVPRLLTAEDMELLKSYGVKTSVDFRGDRELERIPSQFASEPWVQYIHSPTYNAQVAFHGRKMTEVNAFVRWGDKYSEMLEQCTDWIHRTLEIMAAAEGCVIFNCTTGKDRTGIIAALLLKLAGVPDADVIADYCVSQVYLQEVYRELAYTMPAGRDDGSVDTADPFFRTEPENMATMLAYIKNKFGSADEYARSCGVTAESIAALKKRLTED